MLHYDSTSDLQNNSKGLSRADIPYGKGENLLLLLILKGPGHLVAVVQYLMTSHC